MVTARPAKDPATPGPFPHAVQVVLAAGRSERMGSPKALLDFDGRTALRLALDAAAGAGVAESVVVLGRDAEEILGREPLAGLPIRARAVRNLEEGSEQLRSLQIAIETVEGQEYDAFFIHPVDHPLALPSDYRLLLDAFRSGSGATVYILSSARRRGHPILCDRSVAAKLLALPPDGTARDVIEQERIEYVTTPNAGVIEDMDTPEEYRRLLEAYRYSTGNPRLDAPRAHGIDPDGTFARKGHADI